MIKGRKKVLHIFSGYGGGISSLIRNLIENGDKDFAFDVMAFSFSSGESFVNTVINSGGCYFTMPRPKLEGYNKFVSYVSEVLSNNNYDAIHCHISGYAALVFYVIAKRCGISYFFIHAHSTRYDSKINRVPLIRALNKLINYKIATAYFTCSDLAAAYMFGVKNIRKKETILIPNGIAESKFSAILTKEQIKKYNDEFKVDDDSTLILMHVGRFTYAKNHKLILEIAKELQDRMINFRLVMVGDGELFDSFTDKVKGEGLSDHIVLTGRRMDIPLLMQYASKVILPSFQEGLPTVAIESQASGTPIIISDTVTKQCDMEVGLVKFLPISDARIWVDEILKNVNHSSPAACIEKIKEKHFTASTASNLYCDYLRKVLSD